MLDTRIAEVRGEFGRISKKLFASRSQDPDIARREVILNFLLGAMLLFMSVAIVEYVSVWGFSGHPGNVHYQKDVMPLPIVLGITLFFAVLNYLSRRGHSLAVSYVFISILFLLAAYMGFRWGVDVNASLLFYAIVIIMASILVGTRFSLAITLLVSASLFHTWQLQTSGPHVPNSYWRDDLPTQSAVTLYSAIFFAIAIVSWLSNRETERSLRRARQSEALLRRERDLLEIKVEERTKKLREAQAEKMVQLYRFAEFGRLSSGLFHDLVNPLSAVALNMERIKDRGENNEEMLGDTKHCLDSAISATRKMEDMVDAVRKQLSRQKNEAVFSLPEEVGQVVEVLSYKARKAGVEMEFACLRDIRMYGDAIKFNQVVLNLVANAIDAYAGAVSAERKVTVSLEEAEGAVVLRVRDRGMGIPAENLTKIFQPFFTTKEEGGMGIGLSMVKRIVEKDFGGSVALESEPGKGTIFIITLRNQSYGNIQG